MIGLSIWAGDQHVGILEHEPASNLFDFKYTEAWIQGKSSYPLSPQIPMLPSGGLSGSTAWLDLSHEQRSTIVRAFFQNLLPEGQALEVAAETNGVAKGNLTGLLIALGGETAGALRVTLANTENAPRDPNDASTDLREVPLEELSDRIRRRPQFPFAVWDGKVRLSIAGLQDKIAVYEEHGQLFLADGPGVSSTVILKPAPTNTRFADLPAIEHLCMCLASAVGIPTAATRLLHVPEPVLQVERFDRRRAGNSSRVERLHIIDACQALGLSPELKYERPYGDQGDVKHYRDGVSLSRLFSLAQWSPSPLLMRSQMLDRVLFNVLVGNSDAHGKNWSFFIETQGGALSLAPAYDLVDVEAVADEHMSTSFAMGIGDAFSLEELSAFEWASMAEQCQIARKHLASRLKAHCWMLPRALRDGFIRRERDGVRAELLSSFEKRLAMRCEHVAERASKVLKVPASIL